MRQPPDRRRVLWLAAGGAAILVAILFVAALQPPAHSADPTILRPEDAVEATDAGTTPGATEEGGFSLGGGDVVSLAWRLGLVAVILGVSVAGLRWWGKRASGPRSGTGFLRVVDTLAISNGRTIHLVALGDRVIAVGATAQQLTFLNELGPDEARDVLASLPAPEGQPVAAFAAELFRSIRTARRGPARDEIIVEDVR